MTASERVKGGTKTAYRTSASVLIVDLQRGAADRCGGTYTESDLVKARWLLAASGTKGQSVTIWSFDIPIRRRDVAEITARELGRLGLADAIEPTAPIALRDRERGRRAPMRWLRWWLEARLPSLDETAVVVALFGALGGPGHVGAASALRAMTKKRH